MAKPKCYWLIRGYEGLNLIYTAQYPIGAFSEGQMAAALQVLAAKANLNYDEILLSTAGKKYPFRTTLLDVTRDYTKEKKLLLTCGTCGITWFNATHIIE